MTVHRRNDILECQLARRTAPHIRHGRHSRGDGALYRIKVSECVAGDSSLEALHNDEKSHPLHQAG